MTPRGKRAFIGCGIGCGALLLIVIATGIFFIIWIRQPGPPGDPRRLLADDTVGYLEWKLRKEDPETEGFLRALLERTSEIPAQENAPMPEWVLDGISQVQMRRNAAAMEQVLPLVVAWTLRFRGETGREEEVFLLGVRNMGNRLRFVDWLLRITSGVDSGATRLEEHDGETIYEIRSRSGKSLTFFIRDGAIYFTSDLEAARGQVDRLAGNAGGGRGTEGLARLLSSIPAERPLRGAVTNARGAIPRILGRMIGEDRPEDPSLDRLEGATLTGGFTEDRGFAARLDFHYEGGAAPEGSGEALAALAASALARWNVTVESSITVEGGRVGLDLRFPDLLDLAPILPGGGPSR